MSTSTIRKYIPYEHSAATQPKLPTLDQTIYYAKDRVTAVSTILDDIDFEPDQFQLEKMADYILYGKDEKHIDGVFAKDIIAPHASRGFGTRRVDTTPEFSSFIDTETGLMSTEIESATPVGKNEDRENRTRYKVPIKTIKRTKYSDDGTILEYGDDFDADGNIIEPMRRLWERIDFWKARLNSYVGKTPPDAAVVKYGNNDINNWRIKKILVALQQDQYIVKEGYKPQVRNAFVTPTSLDFNFDNDTGYWLTPEEWCRRKREDPDARRTQLGFQQALRDENGNLYWSVSRNTIDLENPKHILAIIENYARLLRRSMNKPTSSTKALCMDFEALVDKTEFSDIEWYVLIMKIAHRNNFQAIDELAAEGVILSEAQFRTIQRSIIPRKLANRAKELRIESDAACGRIPLKRCSKCGRLIPADHYYFSFAHDKGDGFCSQCKECQRKARRTREQERTGRTDFTSRRGGEVASYINTAGRVQYVERRTYAELIKEVGEKTIDFQHTQDARTQAELGKTDETVSKNIAAEQERLKEIFEHENINNSKNGNENN